jgi:parvulin-like peptidyl-prolyl isomerase
MAEVEKLSPGEMSGPIRSHLGFHIVRLTGVKPPRQMRFEEVEAEIRSALANAKRAAAVARIAAQTSAH